MFKVGVVGAGHMGGIHVRLLSGMQDVKISGLYDIQPDMASTLASQYRLETFDSFEELLRESDAVIIASPTSTHHHYASMVVKAGKHVFIEKPVAVNLREAENLLALNSQFSSVVQVNMVERCNPAFLAIQPYLKNIRKSFHHRLAPFTPRGADVSVVMDVMIHDLDLILSMSGGMKYSVKASGEKLVTDEWDVVNAIVEFENGWKAHLTASRVAERKYRQSVIATGDASYKVDMLNSRCYSASGAELLMLNEVGPETIQWHEIPVKPGNAVEEGLKSFISGVLSNKKVVVSLLDGVQCMEMAERIEHCMNQD